MHPALLRAYHGPHQRRAFSIVTVLYISRCLSVKEYRVADSTPRPPVQRAEHWHGLGRVLDQDLHHIWSATTQQIYQEPARLDADGFIRIKKATERSNRPDKKVYAITRAGLDELER